MALRVQLDHPAPRVNREKLGHRVMLAHTEIRGLKVIRVTRAMLAHRESRESKESKGRGDMKASMTMTRAEQI